MRRVSFILSVLALASLVFGAAGCAAQPQAPQTIRIGLITQLSGDMAATGQTVRDGAELAVKEINAAGGVEVNLKKYPLELIVADSEGREDVAIAIAQRMITQDGVLAIIEHERSQTAVPVSWIAENARTVLIGGIASPDFTVDPVTRQPKKYVFRNTFSLDFQGPALAQFALGQMGARRAAVLYDSESAYNRGLAEAFKKTFTEGITENYVFIGPSGEPVGEGLGKPLLVGEVVAFESYKTGDKDFTAQLKRIKEAAPDVLFMPNYLVDVPTQAKQARDMGITAPLLGPDTWAHDLMLKECGSYCEGAFLATDFRVEIPNKLAEKFVADYIAAYGVAPESPAALTYDSVKMLELAFYRGTKVDREALRDGMTRLRTFQGVTGAIAFEPGTGNSLKSANIMQIKNGKFTWFADVSP